MARPSPPMPLLAAALLVAGAIPLGFIWILTSAKFEIGGAWRGLTLRLPRSPMSICGGTSSMPWA
ncbi:hypothetical protein QM331_06540, partial [Pseudomonas aeruginosa]|uniref:hypothetical protein n=1 Tax=Pseudomonas aeruginosa TaxID=287 RepID=UPI0024BC79C6